MKGEDVGGTFDKAPQPSFPVYFVVMKADPPQISLIRRLYSLVAAVNFIFKLGVRCQKMLKRLF